jgi:nucleosome binding factor SPN SPT16 subunit
MMQLGDTICISENGEVINFTEKSPKGLNDIHYELQNNSEDKNEDDNNANLNAYSDNVRVTRHMGKRVDEKLINAEKRKEHQEQLLKEKNDEFKRRLREGENFLKSEAAVKKKDYSHLKCFDSIKNFPHDLKQGKILLDKKLLQFFCQYLNRWFPSI